MDSRKREQKVACENTLGWGYEKYPRMGLWSVVARGHGVGRLPDVRPLSLEPRCRTVVEHGSFEPRGSVKWWLQPHVSTSMLRGGLPVVPGGQV